MIFTIVKIVSFKPNICLINSPVTVYVHILGYCVMVSIEMVKFNYGLAFKT